MGKLTMTLDDYCVIDTKDDDEGVLMFIASKEQYAGRTLTATLFREEETGFWYYSWVDKRQQQVKDQEGAEKMYQDHLKEVPHEQA